MSAFGRLPITGTLHSKLGMYRDIPIYSPDTDVYNIGLGFNYLLAKKSITVQINLPNKTQRFIDLKVLMTCPMQDPNLATLSPGRKGLTLQILYITSGCDYVPYLYGKAKFIQIFCEHAKFISEHAKFISGTEMEGCLSQAQDSSKEKGFLAFLRLIGTLYFKKHLTALVTQFECETPQHLLESWQSQTQGRNMKPGSTKSFVEEC